MTTREPTVMEDFSPLHKKADLCIFFYLGSHLAANLTEAGLGLTLAGFLNSSSNLPCPPYSGGAGMLVWYFYSLIL